MSGGSFDYAYRKVEDVASDIAPAPLPEWECRLRTALADLLNATSDPLKALEWWKSGDTGAYGFAGACEDLPGKLRELADRVEAVYTDGLARCSNGCRDGYFTREVDGRRGTARCHVCNGSGFFWKGVDLNKSVDIAGR